MAVKYFNAGSALMAIFIFLITGLFSWFGNTTLNNKEQAIKTVVVLTNLNTTLKNINANIKSLNLKLNVVERKEVENEKKLYMLYVNMQRGTK